MLKKLLKYDMQDVLPYITIFYTLAIVFAVLTRVFLSFENSIFLNVMGRICSGTTIAMLFNILINTLMRSWVRFKRNLYGDESYITHTLPVTKHAIYLSKFLTAILALVIGVAASLLALFIAYYSEENFQILKSFFTATSAAFGDGFGITLTALIVVMFLEFLSGLQCGFIGTILGHRMRGGKTGFSVLFGFVMYGVTQAAAMLLLFLYALLDSDVMLIFNSGDMAQITPSATQALLVSSSIAYTAVITVVYIVSVKLFKQGVNVD